MQEKAGLPQRAKAAIVLLIWYGIMIILGVAQYAGLLVFVLLIGYVCIIRSLYKLSKELAEAGFVIKTAPIKVAEWKVVAGVLTIVIMGISCGYLFFHSYQMDWKPAVAKEDAKVSEIKEHLIEMGFPKNVLEEDILACEGALRVVMDVSDHPVNAYNRKELRLTHIAVELPG